MSLITKVFGTHSTREIKRIQPIVDHIEGLAETYKAMNEDELRGMTDKLKTRFAAGESLDDLLPDAFATVREAADRVLGLRPYTVQLIGGIVLHQGRIAEMKTGEGKTLVATMPIYLNALSGKGSHVVTVNDYLAKRDSEWMGKVYRYLGLSVGLIIHDIPNKDRRAAYACDVVYGTNNEFGFDYLRDNMVDRLGRMVQRELNYAIVDEVDSILIDEARTPLIISGAGAESSEMYMRADRFVKGLKRHVVVEADDKVDIEDLVGDCDYVVDEKAKTAVLTARGIEKAERHFGIDNLSDTENFSIQHYINNALKANGTMQRDQKYVVTDGEVIIVDDFTGRLMHGRRFSDGLHQAIEAKEGVKIERESKTLATITFQNYFRMYNKLSGMTGTAYTEEAEFRSIYNLDVIQIPTNRPMIRDDENDSVYKTRRGKSTCILRTVMDANQRGQPVLVGTVNVDKSEYFSMLFTKAGVKHNVLNAKNHLREAEIVAQAGRLGAVTIATNMAGRGTDILLGGNPEFLAKQDMRKQGYDEPLIDQATTFNETDDKLILEARDKFRSLEVKFQEQTREEHQKVIDAGGLFIVGTERHEARRIDNQLRGRAGRQGDPGRSRFFLALDDDLIRLFGGERAHAMFDRLNIDETMEIKSGVISNTVESAQKKIEGMNFSARKHVLQFDDVMNIQRNLTYAQRRKVLEGEDLTEAFEKMIDAVAARLVESFATEHDISSSDKATLVLRIRDVFGDLPVVDDLMQSDDDLEIDTLGERIAEEAIAYLDERKMDLGDDVYERAQQQILLYTVDQKWMDHIDQMDQLRNAIGMRSVGQKDPVQEYRMEGSEMFEDMNRSIQNDAVRMIMRASISTGDAVSTGNQVRDVKAGHGEVFAMRQASAQRAQAGAQQQTRAPVKRDVTKVGRNDLCPCGSQKKYKNCCGRNAQ